MQRDWIDIVRFKATAYLALAIVVGGSAGPATNGHAAQLHGPTRPGDPLKVQARPLQGVESSQFELTVSGRPGTGFSGECSLATAAGRRTLRLEGTAPMVRRFAGDAMDCRFSTDGPLTIELRKGAGAVSRSTTSGGTVAIAVR